MARKSKLPSLWQVPERFRERLGEEAGRQRAMFADGHLLLVLHRAPGPDEIQREGRFFWRAPDGTWSSDALGGGVKALNRQLDEYVTLLAKYEQLQENATTADEYFTVLEAVAPLHRSAKHQRDALQHAREMVDQDRNIIVLRDRALEIERTAELLYADAKNGLDFAMAKRAEEQAESGRRMAVSAHRLNLLAAFFFPIATLTAVFGVNLQHGLETLFWPWPFLGVLAVGLLMGAALTSFVTAQPRNQTKKNHSGDRAA